MTKKLILIDGSSLLSTSFFGNVPREYYGAKTEEQRAKALEKVMKTSTGEYTNGVYTMCKVLLNIIKKQQPTHMAIAWDISRNTFRREMYQAYKGHRAETKPELGQQFGTMQRVLDQIGISQFKIENFEADDIIGTFAKKFEEEIPVYILTKDQDALQLISEKTRVWLNTSKSAELYKSRGMDPAILPVPMGYFEFTPLTFEEEYGIKPIQMIDLKALEGDKSDNIPGVSGIGPKAILPLLNEYGSVENIYDAVENNPEKELANFFKEELGISRSPIGNLLKKSQVDLLCEQIHDMQRKFGYTPELINEIQQLLVDIEDDFIQEKIIFLKENPQTQEAGIKEIMEDTLSYLVENDSELVGKEAAYLSKTLATIKTDISEYDDLQLNKMELTLNKDAMRQAFLDLEFNSLIEKI